MFEQFLMALTREWDLFTCDILTDHLLVTCTL